MSDGSRNSRETQRASINRRHDAVWRIMLRTLIELFNERAQPIFLGPIIASDES